MGAAAKSSPRPGAPRLSLASDWGPGFQLVRGGAGDHAPSFQLLSSVLGAPSRDAFFAALDEPCYEPHDRWLVRSGLRIVSHVQWSKRTIRWGGLDLPTVHLQALVTLPEYRQRGFATRVMQVAEQTAREEGAVWASLSTDQPAFFRPLGWVVCGKPSLAVAHTRRLLALLAAHADPSEDQPFIRPLRQVELPMLSRVYEAAIDGRHGPVVRTESYWRWLISRGGVDHVFVALGGRDRKAWDAFNSPVIGYAVMKENRVLELMTHPDPGEGVKPIDVAEQLLARCAGEAVERDLQSLQLHAPADDPLMNLFRQAGGAIQDRELRDGPVNMIRLFDPPAFLEQLAPRLWQRAESARLPRPVELAWDIEGTRQRLVVERRRVRLRPAAKLGRGYLRCQSGEFIRLLLGHGDPGESVERERLYASSRVTLATARTLFPATHAWRSPWDELYL